jgi:hypothetical protein
MIKGRRGKFTQTDTLQNIGGDLSGPIVLVLQGLSTRVTLQNAGTTKTFFAGSPFIVVTGGALLHNSSIPITLVFSTRAKGAIAYKPHVITGTLNP